MICGAGSCSEALSGAALFGSSLRGDDERTWTPGFSVRVPATKSASSGLIERSSTRKRRAGAMPWRERKTLTRGGTPSPSEERLEEKNDEAYSSRKSRCRSRSAPKGSTSNWPVESSMKNGRCSVSSAILSHSTFLPSRCCQTVVWYRKQGLPVTGATMVCGPAALPFTSTSPRAALRILEVGVVSNKRLRARRRNPETKKYKPPAIASNERIASSLIGMKRAKQTATGVPRLFSDDLI